MKRKSAKKHSTSSRRKSKSQGLFKLFKTLGIPFAIIVILVLATEYKTHVLGKSTFLAQAPSDGNQPPQESQQQAIPQQESKPPEQPQQNQPQPQQQQQQQMQQSQQPQQQSQPGSGGESPQGSSGTQQYQYQPKTPEEQKQYQQYQQQTTEQQRQTSQQYQQQDQQQRPRQYQENQQGSAGLQQGGFPGSRQGEPRSAEKPLDNQTPSESERNQQQPRQNSQQEQSQQERYQPSLQKQQQMRQEYQKRMEEYQQFHKQIEQEAEKNGIKFTGTLPEFPQPQQGTINTPQGTPSLPSIDAFPKITGRFEVKAIDTFGRNTNINLNDASTRIQLGAPNSGQAFRVVTENGNQTQLDPSALEKINTAIKLETGSEIIQKGNSISMKRGQVEAQSRFPISFNIATKTFTVETPNGEKTVNVLPDEAVQKLIENKIFSNVQTTASTNAEGTITQTSQIQLTELNNKPVYEVEGTSQQKLLGFFAVGIQKKTFVSAESGDVVSTDQNVFSRFLDTISF